MRDEEWMLIGLMGLILFYLFLTLVPWILLMKRFKSVGMGIGLSVMIVGILSYSLLFSIALDDLFDWHLYARPDEEVIIGSMILTGICMLVNQGLLIHAVWSRTAGAVEAGPRRVAGDRQQTW